MRQRRLAPRPPPDEWNEQSSGTDNNGIGRGYYYYYYDDDDSHLLPYYHCATKKPKYPRKKRALPATHSWWLLNGIIRKTRQSLTRPAADPRVIFYSITTLITIIIISIQTLSSSSKHRTNNNSIGNIGHHQTSLSNDSSDRDNRRFLRQSWKSHTSNTKWKINTKTNLNDWWWEQNSFMRIVAFVVGPRNVVHHPHSINLETIRFAIPTSTSFQRSFPFGRRNATADGGGDATTNVNRDYGTLNYQSISEHDVFARVLLQRDHNSLLLLGAFESSTTMGEDAEEESPSSSTGGGGNTKSYPQYQWDGTQILPKNATMHELMHYYDDDSITVMKNSNRVEDEDIAAEEMTMKERQDPDDDRPRACQAPQFSTLYFPTCNNFHELALNRLYDDPTTSTNPRPGHEMDTLYLASGFYRDAWLVEDIPWIWLHPPYYFFTEVENEHQHDALFTQHDNYDVHDEEFAKYLIIKGYRSAVLKTYQIDHDFDDEAFHMMRSEAIVMERLTKSRRIMNIYGYCAFSTLVEVVPIEFEQAMVYEEGYEEFDVVEKRNEDGVQPYNNFTARQKLEFALEMAESLADLHGFEDGVIVHDDVQLIQWLRTPDGRLKLGDFNRVTIMKWDLINNEYCPFNNGLIYGNNRAPEECAARNLNEKIDLFSLGNNIYAMITGLWMFYEETNDDIVQKKVIAGIHPYLDPRYKERSLAERKLIELMEQCWIYNPNERISIFAAVEFLRNAIEEEMKHEV